MLAWTGMVMVVDRCCDFYALAKGVRDYLFIVVCGARDRFFPDDCVHCGSCRLSTGCWHGLVVLKLNVFIAEWLWSSISVTIFSCSG